MILPSLQQDVPLVPPLFGNFPKGSVLAVHQKWTNDYNINIFDGFQYP
jgi:hypothetical protein